VDVEETSLGMDPQALRAHLERVASRQGGQTVNKLTGRPIRALMPVHIFGHPCRMEELAAIAREWNLVLVEDATEALGSTQDGRPVGSRHTAVFSFNGNKMVTTGGGGAVTTHDEELYQRLKHLTTTAKQSHQWAFLHDQVGYNYRMPNLNAALGCAQMELLPKMLEIKHEVAQRYRDLFAGSDVRFVEPLAGTTSNAWLNAIVLGSDEEREAFLHYTNSRDVMTRPIWRLMSRLAMFEHCQHDGLENSHWLEARVVNLPSSVPENEFPRLRA
jgi:dTDP-4-amino-4,6-dideoxygalactose transaminase